MCGAPPVIENGGPDIDTLPSVLDVGKNLTYVCDEGYSFRSDGMTSRVVTCMEGQYYSHIENCQGTYRLI